MYFDKDWYDNLTKPNFQPPIWIFLPVWVLLYILMIISFGLIVTAPFRWMNILAYVFFVAQLVINLRWGPAFFKEKNLRKAFLLSALLTLLVFLTTIVFFYISVLASLLFLPYLLWCAFASILCFEILELNEF